MYCWPPRNRMTFVVHVTFEHPGHRRPICTDVDGALAPVSFKRCATMSACARMNTGEWLSDPARYASMPSCPPSTVELVQRFYVIAGDCDRHEHSALLAEPRETLGRVAGLRAQPSARVYLGTATRAGRDSRGPDEPSRLPRSRKSRARTGPRC
jgi:hypothetical protein